MIGIAPRPDAARPAPIDVAELLGRPARWASVLRWATIAGLELGAIGPFGSYKANVYSRLVYWTVLFWIGGLVAWPSVVAGMAIGLRKGLPPLFSGTAAVLAACVPLSALSAAGCYLFWPVHASGIRPLEWYGLTALVVLPASAGLLWLELAQWRGSPAAPHVQPREEVTAETMPTRQDRSALPLHLIETALCPQMEDHHVRVHSPGRSHLHYTALSAAMMAMGGRPGLQVHRSWWVARDAVQAWEQDGRSIALILVDGLRVPVARHRVASLRAAGWLAEDRRAGA